MSSKEPSKVASLSCTERLMPAGHWYKRYHQNLQVHLRYAGDGVDPVSEMSVVLNRHSATYFWEFRERKIVQCGRDYSSSLERSRANASMLFGIAEHLCREPWDVMSYKQPRTLLAAAVTWP